MEPFDNNDRYSGILLDIAVEEVIKDSRKFIRVARLSSLWRTRKQCVPGSPFLPSSRIPKARGCSVPSEARALLRA